MGQKAIESRADDNGLRHGDVEGFLGPIKNNADLGKSSSDFAECGPHPGECLAFENEIAIGQGQNKVADAAMDKDKQPTRRQCRCARSAADLKPWAMWPVRTRQRDN